MPEALTVACALGMSLQTRQLFVMHRRWYAADAGSGPAAFVFYFESSTVLLGSGPTIACMQHCSSMNSHLQAYHIWVTGFFQAQHV
jgi:hypothetical protein